jgi:hypothetical protein
MIFAYSHEKVLTGIKTQTRRIVKPEQCAGKVQPTALEFMPVGNRVGDIVNVHTSTRMVYEVGRTYAVQPSRTAKGIARIRITGIRREDARHISHEDALAEGFTCWGQFMETWVQIADRSLAAYYSTADHLWHWWGGRHHNWQAGNATDFEGVLLTRPAARYDAWVLEFELVE